MNIQLSILGLYIFDPSVFDGLTVPDGVDRNAVITEIVSECSDFPLLYPDLPFMRMMIGVWATKERPIWDALQLSTELEYNPIENYDRYEDITRKTVSKTTTSSETTGEASDGSRDNATRSRTSFNSNDFQPTDNEEQSREASSSNSGSTSGETAGEGEEVVTNHMHGNIGVTTAQQMIQGYREVSDFSVIDYIRDSFQRRFCLQLY